MTHRLVLPLSFACVAAGVAACANPARSDLRAAPAISTGDRPTVSTRVPTPSPADTAERALRRWAAFPVHASPRPLVLTGPTIVDPAGGFPDGDTKQAYVSGAMDLPGALPIGTTAPGGQRVIAAGQALNALRRMAPGSTPGTTRLTITDVRLGSGMFLTDRGLRSLPAWTFTFAGVPEPARVLAVPPADRLAPPRDGFGQLGAPPGDDRPRWPARDDPV